MKLLISLLVALTLASSAQAQFGSLMGMAGKSMYDRFMATTPPPLPEGMLGTAFSNVMSKMPGAQKIARHTIRAIADTLNKAHRSLIRMMDPSSWDLTTLPKAAMDTVGNLARTIPELIQRLLELIYGMSDLTSVGGAMKLFMGGGLMKMIMNVVHGVLGLFLSGASGSNFIPNPETVMLIPKGMMSDTINSPGVISGLVAKFMLYHATGVSL